MSDLSTNQVALQIDCSCGMWSEAGGSQPSSHSVHPLIVPCDLSDGLVLNMNLTIF